MKDLLSIDGIAETTAKAFNDGLRTFFDLCSGTPVSISFYPRRNGGKRQSQDQFALQGSETNSGKNVL